jgi:hypothetical protein
MKPHERRINTRKMLDRHVYLSLPSGNGGTVIDVSEGGLGFQSIAPVKADGPIHFRFAFDSATRINAVGELAWIEESGKNGGLRFTELPEEVREQIRVWAGQSEVRAKARVDDISIAGLAMEGEAALRSKAGLAHAAAARRPLLYSLRPPIYSAPYYKLSMFPLEPKLETAPSPIAELLSAAARQPHVAIELAIVLSFLATLGIYAYITANQAGELLFDWGAKIWGGS